MHLQVVMVGKKFILGERTLTLRLLKTEGTRALRMDCRRMSPLPKVFLQCGLCAVLDCEI